MGGYLNGGSYEEKGRGGCKGDGRVELGGEEVEGCNHDVK